MKKLILIFVIAFYGFSAFSQVFLNGDFENTTQVACAYNLTNNQFNESMENVYAFGTSPQVDIQTNNCFVDPQNGSWCIGLSTEDVLGYDAVTIELSSQLSIGNSYELKFWTFGNTHFTPLLDSIKIGLTTTSDSFGTMIFSDITSENIWEEQTVQFVANSNFGFISVQIKDDFNSLSWYQIDNFTITNITGINNNKFGQEISIYPNPTSDNLNIDLGSYHSNISMIITSIEGQIVLDDSFINLKELNIDISELNQGIYFVTIGSVNNHANLKFIKE